MKFGKQFARLIFNDRQGIEMYLNRIPRIGEHIHLNVLEDGIVANNFY